MRTSLFMITLLLLTVIVGCSNNSSGIKKVSVEEYEEVFTEGKTGFVVITNLGNYKDNESTAYLATLNEILIEERVEALQYDVYLSNGKMHNEHINPHSDVTNTENVHYVKRGEVISDFDLRDYSGIELKDELKYYVNLMKKQ